MLHVMILVVRDPVAALFTNVHALCFVDVDDHVGIRA